MKHSLPITAIATRTKTRLEGRGGMEGARAMAGQIEMLASAVVALENVALNRSPAETAGRHLQKTHQAGQRLSAAIAGTRQRATGLLNEHGGKIREAMLGRTGLRAPTMPDEVQRAAEIRAVVRSMPEKERAETLRQAVKDRDLDVLRALLTAPALITGIPADIQRDMRASYEAAVAPEQVQDMAELLETDAALQTAVEAAERAASQAQDERAMLEFIAAEDAAKKAQATFDSLTAAG